MDSQSKVSVEFKPAKRMKKRRELDALVNGGGHKQGPSGGGGGGGGGRGTPLRNGKHELLRNETDSSEEFILPEKSLVRKRGTSTLCSVCVTVCWAVLLVVCLVGIGGLVWMCIQLKNDVDLLRTQLEKVEILNSNIPGEVQDIVTEHQKIIFRISQLESGNQSIEKLQENFTLLVRQVFELEATTKTLSQSIVNLQQLNALQSFTHQVKDLSKSIADLGSNLQTLRQSVRQLQEAKELTDHLLSDIDARVKTLQLSANEQNYAKIKDDGHHAMSSNNSAKLDGLVRDVALMNVTFYTNLDDLRTKYNSQQTSVLELYNYTTLLNTRVNFLEAQPNSQPQSPSDLMPMVTSAVQTVFEEIWNYSKGQDHMIQQNKEQLDSLIALMQAQITGQDSRMSVFSDRLNRFNVSVTVLKNTTEFSVESLNSRLQLLEKGFRSTVPLAHSNSSEVQGKPSLDNLSSTSSSSSSSSLPPFSSSSTVASSSVAIVGESQNPDNIKIGDTNTSSSMK